MQFEAKQKADAANAQARHEGFVFLGSVGVAILMALAIISFISTLY